MRGLFFDGSKDSDEAEVPEQEAHAAENADGGGIDDHRVDDIAEVGHQENLQKRTQDRRAVHRHHGAQKAEDTDGRKAKPISRDATMI